MKFSRRNLAAISLSLLCLGWSVGHAANHGAKLFQGPSDQNSNPSAIPVVVELFTSEGCSSCPPADALLAKFESQQPIAHTQIIALEEHVDYWNNGGWMDPFSGREWTVRQEEYAVSLGNQNPYTPQMVVDGQIGLVGNREGSARAAIEKSAAQSKAHVSLSVTPSTKPGDEQLAVSVTQLSGTRQGDKPEVWMAITESGLHSVVSAGENSGSDLRHASVVRTFRKVGGINLKKEDSFSGTYPVHLDSSWKRQNLRVVVFVQGQKSRQILGAATVPIER
jgi:hypothetical protein